MLISIVTFSNTITKIEDFYYNSDLTLLEPFYMEEVFFKNVNSDGSLTLLSDNSFKVFLIGVEVKDYESFKSFNEEKLGYSKLFISYDSEFSSEENKYVYLWKSSFFEGKEIYVLWNAALIINGVCGKSISDENSAFHFIFENLTIPENISEIQIDEDINLYEQLGEIGDFGFHNINWKMSKIQIIYRITDQLVEQKEERLKYISKVLSHDCLLYFLFDGENLKEVRYVFGLSNKESLISLYDKVKKRMVNSYGNPHIERKGTENEESYAVSFSDIWEFSDTTFEMQAETLGQYVYAMIIRYKSKIQ